MSQADGVAHPVGPASAAGSEQVGAVVIGRNEGEALRRCLGSLVGFSPVVYVDSGSTDGSVAWARDHGAVVVELDLALPFTAARARNAGLARLRELESALTYVQFIDGDCELAPGWREAALAKLRADPSIAVVCGRRRERHPDASPYNRLCDIEWNTPIGEAQECGGDALMRAEALQVVGGFNAAMIAGEEPDLCFRLRQRGHRVWRVDAEMTVHDANITSFKQWFRRTLRSGHAYAEGSALHRRTGCGYNRRQVWSNLLWGGMLPVGILVLVPLTTGFSLLLLLAYVWLGFRIFRALRRRGETPEHSRLYAVYCVVGKIPSAYGQIRYWFGRAFGKRSAIIEYKRTRR